MDHPDVTGIDITLKSESGSKIPDYKLNVDISKIDLIQLTKFCEIFFDKFKEETGIQISFEEIFPENITYVHSHFTGGCKMGEDSRNSIVDFNCEVHNVKNLFISGPSTFPTHSFCNPFMMIGALSLRLGEYLNAK